MARISLLKGKNPDLESLPEHWFERSWQSIHFPLDLGISFLNIGLKLASRQGPVDLQPYLHVRDYAVALTTQEWKQDPSQIYDHSQKLEEEAFAQASIGTVPEAVVGKLAIDVARMIQRHAANSLGGTTGCRLHLERMTLLLMDSEVDSTRLSRLVGVARLLDHPGGLTGRRKMAFLVAWAAGDFKSAWGLLEAM